MTDVWMNMYKKRRTALRRNSHCPRRDEFFASRCVPRSAGGAKVIWPLRKFACASAHRPCAGDGCKTYSRWLMAGTFPLKTTWASRARSLGTQTGSETLTNKTDLIKDYENLKS